MRRFLRQLARIVVDDAVTRLRFRLGDPRTGRFFQRPIHQKVGRLLFHAARALDPSLPRGHEDLDWIKVVPNYHPSVHDYSPNFLCPCCHKFPAARYNPLEMDPPGPKPPPAKCEHCGWWKLSVLERMAREA